MGAKLYSTTFCPYAWCTRIVLNEKGVPFEVFEVDLKSKQPEFLAVSPAAKSPVFVDGETNIPESMVINEYIEEKYPLPNLLGENPQERAIVRSAVIDHCWYRSQPLARLTSLLMRSEEDRDDGRMHKQLRQWYQYLDELDAHFQDEEWRLLGRYTIADISIYTTVAVSCGFGMPIGERPALQSWLAGMATRETVKRSAPQAIPAIV